jgi:hypothetical protein
VTSFYLGSGAHPQGSNLALWARAGGNSLVNGQIQYGPARVMTSTATAGDTADADRAECRAAAEALQLAEQIAREGPPIVACFGRLPRGESCHFVTPVRFGRRRADHFGHLELTSSWMRFHGALDMSIIWSEVASVERSGHDIVISLADSTRQFRFHCDALHEAARGVVVASHLANAARQAELDERPGA